MQPALGLLVCARYKCTAGWGVRVPLSGGGGEEDELWMGRCAHVPTLVCVGQLAQGVGRYMETKLSGRQCYLEALNRKGGHKRIIQKYVCIGGGRGFGSWLNVPAVCRQLGGCRGNDTVFQQIEMFIFRSCNCLFVRPRASAPNDKPHLHYVCRQAPVSQVLR